MNVHRPTKPRISAVGLKLRRLLGSGRPKRGQFGAPASSAPGTLADWSDAELYSVWRATAAELLRGPRAERTAITAEARKYLLTEIERRYPTETAAWLTSDTIMSGEPPFFLRP